MRIVRFVALCATVVACAVFGGDEPDPFGVYDMVSMGGESIPTAEVAKAWVELKADTTGSTTWVLAESSEEYSTPFGEYSLGKLKNGCIPFLGLEWKGFICGDTFRVAGPEYTAVFEKRR